jgi:hypothetical protein
MVPVLHAGTPHRVSLRGFERSHPQLVCVLIREMGSEAVLCPLVASSRRPVGATSEQVPWCAGAPSIGSCVQIGRCMFLIMLHLGELLQ